MVRIPNRGSARYLARKYNRNETYIRYVCVCVCVCVFVMETTLNRSSIGWRLGMDCSFVNNERSARNAFQDLDLFFSN